jgi:hypothetical protein
MLASLVLKSWFTSYETWRPLRLRGLPPFSPGSPGSDRCVGDMSLLDWLRWLCNQRVAERIWPLALEVEATGRGLYKGALGGGVSTMPSLSWPLLSKLTFIALSLHVFASCLRFLLFSLRFLEVASPVSPPPHQASFFGPYRHLLNVRVSRWSARFEECMVASVEAHEFVVEPTNLTRFWRHLSSTRH